MIQKKPGTALALRHVMFEDAGLVAEVLQARQIPLSYVEVPSADLAQIDVLSPDLLVILGGPIGVYDDRDYPWLVEEVRLIGARLAAERPTLGICLGAQLMAKALGARVYPGAKEIGWAPLALTEEGRHSALAHVDGGRTPVLHWHGDTFDLPDGAIRLAATEQTANQAFAIGDHALGLQFHIEASGRDLERWFVGHAVEIAATPDVNVKQLRAETLAYSAGLERCSRLALHAWLDRAL